MPKAPRLLTPRQDEFVDGVRHALGDLRAALVRAGADATDEHTVQSSLQQLDDFFLLVVVGEFNAGKSALINALLGDRILTEGVTPTPPTSRSCGTRSRAKATPSPTCDRSRHEQRIGRTGS